MERGRPPGAETRLFNANAIIYADMLFPISGFLISIPLPFTFSSHHSGLGVDRDQDFRLDGPHEFGGFVAAGVAGCVQIWGSRITGRIEPRTA
jgi:hypothetical protein